MTTLYPAFPMKYVPGDEFLKFPCMYQPLYKGMRLKVVINKDNVVVFDIDGYELHHFPKIIHDELLQIYYGKEITFDTVLTSQDKLILTDVINNESFQNRILRREKGKYIKLAYTGSIIHPDDVQEKLELCKKDGYEGILMYNGEARYQPYYSRNFYFLT